MGCPGPLTVSFLLVPGTTYTRREPQQGRKRARPEEGQHARTADHTPQHGKASREVPARGGCLGLQGTTRRALYLPGAATPPVRPFSFLINSYNTVNYRMVLDLPLIERAHEKKGNPHRGSAFAAAPRPRAGSPGKARNPSHVPGSSGRWPLAQERRAATPAQKCGTTAAIMKSPITTTTKTYRAATEFSTKPKAAVSFGTFRFSASPTPHTARDDRACV